MAFLLPPLPYTFGALEPHVDARTMEIHHGKHHGAYVAKLNELTANTPAEHLDIETLCKSISAYPAGVRNNGGGHYNHSFFWTLLTPKGTGGPVGALAETIKATFGSPENMMAKFGEAALGRFGSGWVWLIKGADGKLAITSTANQDNPLMDVVDVRGVPVLGLDVWEHAYYLNYQNRRKDYVDAWWNIVDWKKADAHFSK